MPKRSPRCGDSRQSSAMLCMSDGSIIISPSVPQGRARSSKRSRTWCRCNERPSPSSNFVPPKMATTTTQPSGTRRRRWLSRPNWPSAAKPSRHRGSPFAPRSRRSGSSTRSARRLRRHADAPPGRSPSAAPPTARKFMAQRQARQQSDQHSAIRQALSSGRPLTPAELANASPEIKATMKDKRDRSRREDAFLRFVSKQRSSKGRNGNGGRSGR